MNTTIKLNNIEAEVIRKRIKNIYLRVYPSSGNVRISAPLQASSWKIREFAKSKLDWIKNKQKKILKNKILKNNKYINNETHYFRGNSYALKIVENKNSSFVELQDQEMILNIPPEAKVEERRKVIEKWYRDQLTLLIVPLLNKWENRLNVSVKKFYIRKMKTRWGSCTPRSQNIRFNLELVKTSPKCLEYVVVHELVHLIESSHNRRFKAIMDQFFPNWKLFKKELNKLNIYQ